MKWNPLFVSRLISMQLALFEYHTDKVIDTPPMKILTGTYGQSLESSFKNWHKKYDYHNGVITKE